MWLVYLRFDDQDTVKTYHVRTSDLRAVNEILACAEQHGLTSTAKLVEYAGFISSGTILIQPILTPNFHFYLYEDWMEHWKKVHVQSRYC